MRGTVRLGRLYGVPMEIHWLFVLFLAGAGYQGWNRGGLAGALFAVVLLILIFACILAHEIGHTLQAQSLGIPVRRIVLMPMGGLAQLSQIPERPVDELRVALAGPAVNLGFGLIFSALAWAWILPLSSQAIHAASPAAVVQWALRGPWPAWLSGLWYMGLANLGIAAFNLVPAFPMDGGRIARSTLAMLLPRLVATRVVSWLGWALGMATLLLAVGAARRWGTPAAVGLLLVGSTAVYGAGAEEALEKSQITLRRILARAAVRQPTWVLSPTDPVGPALADTMRRLQQSLLPVTVEGRVVGVVTGTDVQAALRRQHSPGTVAHLMRTRFVSVAADEDLWRAQQLLTGAEVGGLPVLDGEQLHGLLTDADIRAAFFAPPTAGKGAPQLIPAGQAQP